MTIPRTMKGFQLTGHGGPEKLVWRLDIAVPDPAPGEVLIRVGASSVNNTDINTRVGWYSKSVRGDTADTAGATGVASDADGGWGGTALSFPRIQGADCCGKIVAVGAGREDAGERTQRTADHSGSPEAGIRSSGGCGNATMAGSAKCSGVSGTRPSASALRSTRTASRSGRFR